MRGKESDGGQQKTIGRITPAYAGKRYLYKVDDIDYWDHPRLCGEKSMQKLGRLRTIGSPPPMRGKVQPHIDYHTF